ncbi:MAG: hypothetical protein KDD01_04405 [Phaeodactylibacter sp.]|nr:hypothetical protein [Phaeodactylibacter sp.]
MYKDPIHNGAFRSDFAVFTRLNRRALFAANCGQENRNIWGNKVAIWCFAGRISLFAIRSERRIAGCEQQLVTTEEKKTADICNYAKGPYVKLVAYDPPS